jgi:N-acetylneuraminate synthase
MSATAFLIGDRKVGNGAPCLIVAEVAQAHDGSLAMAHAYVDAVAGAGADAVKFQCHLGEPKGANWRVEPRWQQDADRDAYWQRTGFTPWQWEELAGHAEKAGLIFLCSPFSVEAVRLLDPLVQAWKLPSGEVHPGPLLDAIAESNRNGKPVLVSHGMSSWDEVIWSTGFYPVALLQCTSMYPTPADKVGLGVLREWRERFGCPLGLSDHSGSIYPSLAAVALGASIVEVHVKLSEYDQGLDASSSITIADLKRLVEGVRVIEQAMMPVDKDAMARELQPMRELFMGEVSHV